jgi:diaminopimelate decarboxylase
VPGERIVFSGVGKTRDEIALALQHGIFAFNVESEAELHAISEVAAARGAEARIAFRVNPDVDARTHHKISTGRADDKFGVPWQEAPRLYDLARDLPGIAARGVHMHIGSQITDLAPLGNAFSLIAELVGRLREAGHRIDFVNAGGGLGVPYHDNAEPPPRPELYASLVKDKLSALDCRLLLEPGRMITANAGVLLSRVIRVKPGLPDPFVIVDAAMNDLMRPALYDAHHEIDPVRPTGERMTANVVGPVCESGDTFATGRAMGRVGADELVVFRTAGAYAATMASTYNSRPLTAEVIVRGSEWAVVRERQDLEALIRADKLPPWLGESA